MVSLTKIRNYIKQYKNRNFRASVAKEKNQKYLFRDRTPQNTRGRWSIFRKSGERLSPFSRFLKDKIQITQSAVSGQEYYLKYIGIFLICACIYIVVYSPYFLLSPSKVLIEGESDGVDISIAYRSIEDLYGKNIFLINEQEVARTIKKYQKNISLIRIDMLYPNNLKILLTGYQILFDIDISGVKNKKWGMTENGVLIPRDSIETTPRYLLSYIDASTNEDLLYDYRELIEEVKTRIIKRTIELFESTWPDIGLQKVAYLRKENELHMILKNGIRILFTLQDFSKKTGEAPSYRHLQTQLIGLKSYIDQYKKDLITGSYTYIDARIPGKIFACREKALCEKNIATIYPDLIR